MKLFGKLVSIFKSLIIITKIPILYVLQGPRPILHSSRTCVRTLCMACRLTFIKLIYFRRVTLTFIMLAVRAKKQHIIRIFEFPLLHFQSKVFLIHFSQTIFYGGKIHMRSNVTFFRIKSSVCYC